MQFTKAYANSGVIVIKAFYDWVQDIYHKYSVKRLEHEDKGSVQPNS